MTREELDKIKEMDRYKGFTMCPEEFFDGVEFGELFEDEDFDVVQVHDATLCGDGEIVGFAGVCQWKNEKLTPLDGDVYSPAMRVLGYERFEVNDEDFPEYSKGLDILVEEW